MGEPTAKRIRFDASADVSKDFTESTFDAPDHLQSPSVFTQDDESTDVVISPSADACC
jgi:hypothetical protein